MLNDDERGIRNRMLGTPQVRALAVNKDLIIIGNGQESLRAGVRHRSNKYFNAAAQNTFRHFTKKRGDAKLKHVKSSKEMTSLIKGKSWDVVLYFGHGVVNRPELDPGFGAKKPTLKLNEFAAALKQANVKQVYLLGCQSGYTGLARALSKALPSVSVYGTFSDLDVKWIQHGKAGQIQENKFIITEKLIEYRNGFQMKNGKKAARRNAEINDPIVPHGDPLGQDTVPQ
ncbi:MAG: hypothetical protein V3W31_08945 [Thermodesulfobacteriota bacterium]